MKTKNMDLLEKLSRKVKTIHSKHRSDKRILENSIEERHKEIKNREIFGQALGNRHSSGKQDQIRCQIVDTRRMSDTL